MDLFARHSALSTGSMLGTRRLAPAQCLARLTRGTRSNLVSKADLELDTWLAAVVGRFGPVEGVGQSGWRVVGCVALVWKVGLVLVSGSCSVGSGHHLSHHDHWY